MLLAISIGLDDDLLPLFSNELDDTKEETILGELREKIGLDLQTIPKDIWPYIGKHLRFFDCGVMRGVVYGRVKEYSIADYIKDHGQPKVKKQFNLPGFPYSIDLEGKGLTSLFGIRLVLIPEKVKALSLFKNCFGDISLDVQGQAQPFVGFDTIEVLYLGMNSLKGLPQGMFKGLSKLNKLYLFGNRLRIVREGIFTDLDNLRILNLKDNQFDEKQQEQLKKTLNNVDITF